MVKRDRATGRTARPGARGAAARRRGSASRRGRQPFARPSWAGVGWVGAQLALAVCVGGCSRSTPEPPPVRTETPGERSPEEVDRLRSLPYAGFSSRADSQPDGVVEHDPDRAYAGYTLYSVHEKCRADLIDMEGAVVRSWSLEASSSWSNVELLPDGDLLVVGWDASEEGEPGIADEKRYLVRFAWDGTLRWKRSMPAHHDVELTPRGQLLTLTFARRLIPSIDTTIVVRDDRLTVLDLDGRAARSISFYDVLSRSPDVFPLSRVAPNRAGGAPWIDLFHGNSVEWMRRPALAAKSSIYGPANVLVCFRHQDRIAILNLDEQRVVWSWGLGVISGPHDAQVLDDGHILLFDNGIARGWSRAIELDPLTGRIVWEYRAPIPKSFYTVNRGSAQRLPNGNTLIANSDDGTAFEVTKDGAVVWRYNVPDRNDRGQRAAIVRAKRHERALIDRLRGSGSAPASATPTGPP
jgi:hypothetical protein